VSAAALLFLILALVLVRQQTPVQELSLERITANRQQGRPVQALYQIEAWADREGWIPETLRLAGDVWHEMGDTAQALPYWEAASAGLPNDTLLARMLADAYLTLQRWPQAVDQLNRLVELDFSDAWAHYQLGMLRAAFDPPTAETHLKIAERVPEYQDVAATLLFVIDEHGSDPLIGMPVGLVLADADLWPQAELAFQYAADVGQQYPEALAYTALARDRQGKDGSAAIARAVALGSQNAVVRFIQGLHLREQNDLAGSLDALVQAAESAQQLFGTLGLVELQPRQNAVEVLEVTLELVHRGRFLVPFGRDCSRAALLRERELAQFVAQHHDGRAEVQRGVFVVHRDVHVVVTQQQFVVRQSARFAAEHERDLVRRRSVEHSRCAGRRIE